MKNEERFIRFDDLDSGVSDVLHHARKQAANRAMTPAQRKRAARQAARNKVTIDIPPAMEEQLKGVAADLSVPFSGLVVYLLDRAMGLVPVSEIKAARLPSRSMRYEYVLRVESEK